MVQVEEDWDDAEGCGVVGDVDDRPGGCDQNGYGGEVVGRIGRRFYGVDRNERGGEEVSATGCDPSAGGVNNAVPRRFHGIDYVVLVDGGTHCVEDAVVHVDRVHDNGFAARGIERARGDRGRNFVVAGG